MSDIKFDMKNFIRLFSGEGKKQELSELSELVQAPMPENCLFCVSYGTDTGQIRATNEDSFFVDGKCTHVFGESEHGCYVEQTEGTHVFGLFDGMGGEDYGEIASELCAKAMESAYEGITSAVPDDIRGLMTEVCRSADNAICDMIKERGAIAGGSTFVSACVLGDTVQVYWLGDSRVYLWQDGVLEQLTCDHTVAAAKIAAGIYSAEEGTDSYDHHALTHFIGMNRLDEGMTVTACEPRQFKEGSAVLLCSDGLTDMLTDAEIAEILSEDSAAPALQLIAQALENGGRDNVTCIVIKKP